MCQVVFSVWWLTDDTWGGIQSLPEPSGKAEGVSQKENGYRQKRTMIWSEVWFFSGCLPEGS